MLIPRKPTPDLSLPLVGEGSDKGTASAFTGACIARFAPSILMNWPG